jgi:hypothetical protein
MSTKGAAVDAGTRRTLGAFPMSDTPPDHLSTNPKSPHFDMDVLQRGIGIRFKGRERNVVEEYCISEGWIRVAAGKTRDRHGNPLTIKLTGEVEAWYENPAEGEDKPADAE